MEKYKISYKPDSDRKYCHNRSFTLVELVIVIIIFAIIAIIAIPKFVEININAKNSTDDYTIRKLKAVANLLYYKKLAQGTGSWPTGSEIAEQVPNLNMTTEFTPNRWCYVDSGDTVIFYCNHSQGANATGRRWWTYYRVDSGSYKAGQFVEGSEQH